MNGISGFQAGCGKTRLRARLTGKARHARKARSEVRSSKNFELRTSSCHPSRPSRPSRLSRSSCIARTSHHTYRFLQEQRPQFGTGAWHLLHTHDLIALSTGISTKRETVPDTIFRPQFGTGAWRLLRTHDLIALSANISTKRETVPEKFSCPLYQLITAPGAQSAEIPLPDEALTKWLPQPLQRE